MASESRKVLLVGIAAGVEHQPADGIGRVAAVGQHILHGVVARDGLVLAKGGQQIGKRLLGNGAGANGLGQRNKDRMTRAAFVAGIQFASPQIEQSQRLRRVAHFVAQIVGDAAVGVDRVKMRPQRLGQKP